jgi:hypothetical protein
MPINAAAERLALNEEFFQLTHDLGVAPARDGVIPGLIGERGGAVTFYANSAGFVMISQVEGEAPVFSLTADGTQLLSFDPLDVHVVVEAGSWALLMTATTPTGQVQREFELIEGDNQVGFTEGEGEGDDATAIFFTLHGFGENPPFDAVRFVSIAASEVNYAEGYDPDAARGAEDGSADQPTADDGSVGDAADQEEKSQDDVPDLVSLTARVSDDILWVPVGLGAPGAFKVLALPADQFLHSAEEFDAAFGAGLGAADPGGRLRSVKGRLRKRGHVLAARHRDGRRRVA